MQSTRKDFTLQNLLDLKRFSKFEGLSEILKTKALLQKMQSGSPKRAYSLVNERAFLSKTCLKEVLHRVAIKPCDLQRKIAWFCSRDDIGSILFRQYLCDVSTKS